MFDIATARIYEIRAGLRIDGLDLDQQAATMIVRDFGGGSLLEWGSIREHVYVYSDGLFVQWRNLGDAYDKGDGDFVYLSSSARGALDLALALATLRPIKDLGSVLCRFDSSNSAVVLRALSIPLHQRLS